MNQRIWSGLTVTLLTTVLGTAASTQAQQNQTVDQSSLGSPPAAQVSSISTTTTPTPNQSSVQTTDVVKVGELQSQAETAEEAVIARIESHELAGRQAAILYVRDIPVLTFFGSGSATDEGIRVGQATESQKRAPNASVSAPQSSTPSKIGETVQRNRVSGASPTEDDPIWRATAVAAKINQLSQNNTDAEAIAVRWNQECNCYSIEAQGQELVKINEKTTIPDTTQNLAEDALQATNRLRRLVSNAPPIQEIAGLPPAPQARQVTFGPIRVQINGIASWYGPGFHGRRSASGERYNQNAMTAAHRTLPFGTRVQVTNLNNGRSVVVRINDRGPFVRGRVIDLSAAAARVLGVMHSGIAPVQLDVLDTSQTIANDNHSLEQ